MSTIFTRIINGELPAHKVAETDSFLAFLDINPLHEGHTLVVPKKEVDYLFDLEEELYLDFWKFAKEVSKKIEKVISCERIGVAVIGLEVPHAHIHLVPISSVQDINFSREKLILSNEELLSTCNLIASA